MTQETITIEAPSGLHARPVTELVRLVKSFAGTKVTLSTASREVRANSMLSILSLGLKKEPKSQFRQMVHRRRKQSGQLSNRSVQ